MRGMLKWVLLPVVVVVCGAGAGSVLAGDRDKYCDKCHQPTVTETLPGETVTIVGPERTRTVTETLPAVTVTETLPAVTVVETEPAETIVETIVKKAKPAKPRIVVKWRDRPAKPARVVIRNVCKKPPPPTRPCCEGAG